MEIHRDNLIWQNNKYVIPMRLLNPFFAVASKISADLTIRFNIEKDVKKLFENSMRIEDQAVTEEVDRNPPRLKAVFYEPPKTNYCLHIYISIYQEATETFTMSQIKGKRTGEQPVYYEKSIKIRQNSFSGILNFNNVGTQFEWTMISIIPVLSRSIETFVLHTT